MGSVAILLTGNGRGNWGGLYRIGVRRAFADVVTDTLRALAMQQMPAYHK